MEIRVVEGLVHKPKSAPSIANPFLPPYAHDLLVAEDEVVEEGDSSSEHFVILVRPCLYQSLKCRTDTDRVPSNQLNKYPAVPRHFLLVTKMFTKQNAPLTPSELLAAHSILTQLGKREKHIMFYNSGENSGASFVSSHPGRFDFETNDDCIVTVNRISSRQPLIILSTTLTEVLAVFNSSLYPTDKHRLILSSPIPNPNTPVRQISLPLSSYSH